MKATAAPAVLALVTRTLCRMRSIHARPLYPRSMPASVGGGGAAGRPPRRRVCRPPALLPPLRSSCASIAKGARSAKTGPYVLRFLSRWHDGTRARGHEGTMAKLLSPCKGSRARPCRHLACCSLYACPGWCLPLQTQAQAGRRGQRRCVVPRRRPVLSPPPPIQRDLAGVGRPRIVGVVVVVNAGTARRLTPPLPPQQ